MYLYLLLLPIQIGALLKHQPQTFYLGIYTYAFAIVLYILLYIPFHTVLYVVWRMNFIGISIGEFGNRKVHITSPGTYACNIRKYKRTFIVGRQTVNFFILTD